MEYITSLFKTIRILFSSVSVYVILLDVFYLRYFFKGRHYGKSLTDYVGNFFSKKNVIILCQFVLILGIFFSPLVFSRFQNTNIGSFLEKDSYCEQYYVYIRDDATKQKSYRVKADIMRSDYGYEDGEGFVVQGKGYFVLKVYWGNGGYLTFVSEDELGITGYPDRSVRVYPSSETRVYDYKHEDYYITLTTEKVKP